MAKRGKDESLFNDLVTKSKTIDGISMDEYIQLLKEDARPARTSFQRVYDMIEETGFEKFKEFKKDLVRYNFFNNMVDGEYTENSIFGLEENLMELVNHFKGAAYKLGAEKRVLLLHGPVSSAKSTIARLLKRGLEDYSYEQPLFAHEWVGLGELTNKNEGIIVDRKKLFDQICQMHEDPIKLLSRENKAAILREINEANKGKDMKYPVERDGNLCPHCRFNYKMLMKYYDGDWNKVMKHVRINRIYLSEADRVGIGTFQPKDEKNQDSTELTGNIDYRKIALIGADSDPRAFNFDGELCIANRGIVEFIEILKLETAFLYDLLTASQEHEIKPKKFALTKVDEIILGHTNEEEYKKFQEDEMMRALRDRTKRINIPYNVKLSHEIMVYSKDYNKKRVPKHIAPHAIEMAAMWAVLTRIDAPKEELTGALTKMQKLRLYDGEHIPKYTEDFVKKLKEDSEREGLDGISPRFIQNAIYEAITSINEPCVNAFMILSKLKNDLKTSTLVNSAEEKTNYRELLGNVEKEYEDIIKDEIQRVISSDATELDELYQKYILNLKAFMQKETMVDNLTGRDKPADERFMRSIEEKVPVDEADKESFRTTIMQYIACCKIDDKKFDFRSNVELRKGLEKKLFEDKKESINFQQVLLNEEDAEEELKINKIADRLIKDFGYCNVCAKNTLELVASIFAKGDVE